MSRIDENNIKKLLTEMEQNVVRWSMGDYNSLTIYVALSIFHASVSNATEKTHGKDVKKLIDIALENNNKLVREEMKSMSIEDMKKNVGEELNRLIKRVQDEGV